jgi:GntR family transcriptional regulator, transcriptional repressor for pyruvate dehydrogenase complex
MALKPITKTRLSEAAIEQIKELIISNNMEPGSKLPSERDLVNAFGISRTSIREALRMLEIMGLVEVKPGKGIYVKGLTGDLFMPLSSLLSTHRETLHHHFEARLVLEPEAAAMAAKRASKTDIKRLKKVMATFQENIDKNNLVAFIRADIQFHRLIANATSNRTIEILMNTITRHDFDGWRMTLRTKGRPLKTVAEHNKIFKAIAEGDGKKARSAMRSHLKAAIKNLQEAGFESAISDG